MRISKMIDIISGRHKNDKTELHFTKKVGGVAALVCIPEIVKLYISL